jgi:hypothetical protein
MKTGAEKRNYPIVQRWLKRHFLCFKTAINKGLSYSRVDVIGVRDVGGQLSGEVQTIAIEVKQEGWPFATTTGQTLGYNVYANRVYLAESRKEPFSTDEMDIASHLGVGLIQIRNGKCSEILSSPFYAPIRRLNLRLLESLGLGRCQFCESFFETGKAQDLWANVIKEDVNKAIGEGKGVVFYNQEVADRKRKIGLTTLRKGDTYERRFVCSDCVWSLLNIQKRRIKAMMLSEFVPRGGRPHPKPPQNHTE